MKTSELQGPALDWAVAKCWGLNVYLDDGMVRLIGHAFDRHYVFWTPSTDWEQAGPIIERERIGFRFSGDFGFCAWKSYGIGSHQNEHSQYGPTPLVAAMRCYVASKLGDEVEIPKELAEVNA
jgi:hypothetical protein